ncbi:MAG: DUF3883 domain-containing protein, partial [Anaerolineae bacterium]
TVVDVSAQKCGWDITSWKDGRKKDEGGRMNLLPDARHIEVKGRAKGTSTVTITRNEMLYALNQAEKFLLAIVLVGDDDSVDGPYYLRNPFDAEPGWGVASVNYDLGALLARARQKFAD